MNKKFLGAASTALMIEIFVILMLVSGAWGQSKFKTLHKFTGGKDGANPVAVPILDQSGNLYGTTLYGGAHNAGTVFELTPNADGSWTESVLYTFTGGDGGGPQAGLIFDADGNLYGTGSGGAYGQGTVFMLTPNLDGSWTESVLYSFCPDGPPCSDGMTPSSGLVLDAAGNLYGTTQWGGSNSFCNGGGCGTVFKVTRNSDQSWTESVLHSFCVPQSCEDGIDPQAGMIFDQAGNLYGTTSHGSGGHGGVVFELTPNPDGSWTEKVLDHFTKRQEGSLPSGGLIFDQAGNLYGATWGGGSPRYCGGYGCGVAYKLTRNPDGSWKEKVLHYFTNGKDGGGPTGGLIFDQTGNLYGTTGASGARGYGVVFKLAPNSNGGWTVKALHAFGGHPGAGPESGVILDAAGNLYGTTVGAPAATFGSVFKITP